MHKRRPVGRESFKRPRSFKSVNPVKQLFRMRHSKRFCSFFFFCSLFEYTNLSSINLRILSALNANTNSNSASAYNELRITQSYNTVLAVLGENAVCQNDRNLPGTPVYCDQTTTRFTVSATASSSTIYAVAVNRSVELAYDYFLLLTLLLLSILMQKYCQWIVRSLK